MRTTHDSEGGDGPTDGEGVGAGEPVWNADCVGDGLGVTVLAQPINAKPATKARALNGPRLFVRGVVLLVVMLHYGGGGDGLGTLQ